MKNLTIIIPCAGNSSRFSANLPKSLTNFNGKAFLNNLLTVVDSIFQEIIIPIQPGEKNKELFLSKIDLKFHDKIKLVESTPGRGDGGAILDGFNFMIDQTKYFFVCWGDTYIFNANIFREIFSAAELDAFSSLAYVPLSHSKDPYVTYTLEENQIKDTLLSIDGHIEHEGYEDQSIFLLSPALIKILSSFDKKTNPHAEKISETSLLRFFKYAAAENHKLFGEVLGSKATMSFNTQEELVKILKLDSLNKK